MTVTLAPGKEEEVKVVMKASAKLRFSWKVEGWRGQFRHAWRILRRS